MVGFLLLLMIAGLCSALFGLVSGLWAFPQIATAPSIEVMPKLIGAFLALVLSLLLTAVAGGLASLLTIVTAFRLEWRAMIAWSGDRDH